MIAPMPKSRLPHLQREASRHGRHKWYFRKDRGPRIRLPDEYGTADFMAAYQAALSGQAMPVAQTRKPGTGSLAWLIARYRDSSNWLSLAPATRYQRERIFAGVIAKAGHQDFINVTAKSIRSGREERQATPFMANNYLRAVKGLFAWAVEAEYLTENPAIGVTELKTSTDGHTPWTIDDVRRYEARWPAGTRERVWLHVLIYTGLRLGDACTIGRQHMRDGWLKMTAEKTGEELNIPVLPPLAATLAAGPTGDLAFIASAHGRPFVKESFGNAFRDACRAAGIVGKSAHGTRKMLAEMAAELGASEELLKAWFGWRSNRMSEIYTRKASKKRMAGRLGDLFAGAPAEKNAPATDSSRTLSSGAGTEPKKPMKSSRKI